jgi:hypothetical protein
VAANRSKQQQQKQENDNITSNVVRQQQHDNNQRVEGARKIFRFVVSRDKTQRDHAHYQSRRRARFEKKRKLKYVCVGDDDCFMRLFRRFRFVAGL